MHEVGAGFTVLKDTTTPAATTQAKAKAQTPKTFPSTSVLRRGSKGQGVGDLQAVLSSFGFNPGPVDSIFGTQTEAAVKQFQAKMGLQVDGIVGPLTQNAISNYAANQSTTANAAANVPVAVKNTTDLIFSGEYTIEEIQSSLDAMYSSAPAHIKNRAAKTKSVIESSKEKMKILYANRGV